MQGTTNETSFLQTWRFHEFPQGFLFFLQDNNEYQIYLQNLFSLQYLPCIASCSKYTQTVRPFHWILLRHRNSTVFDKMEVWEIICRFWKTSTLPWTAEAWLQTLKFLPGITYIMAAFDFELKDHWARVSWRLLHLLPSEALPFAHAASAIFQPDHMLIRNLQDSDSLAVPKKATISLQGNSLRKNKFKNHL